MMKCFIFYLIQMIFASIFALCMLRQGMAYLNAYDQDLNFACPKETQSVSHVESIHDNHKEDRMFDISCSDVTNDVSGVRASCFVTGHQNQYDQLLAYECPGNHYISGMYSHHDNKYEDRIWRFKCCEMHDVHLDDCDYTQWTNAYDGAQNFHAPAGKVMKGVVSIHDNHKEDRQYKYQLCNVIRATQPGVVGK
ncbi:hemagglutinin/amebocyte aggregation factor-like isoform X1 [Ruditapes philippinarum]|uniref:hemagglutinin/amebocyte aggregation factor-like isoform X1 n=2 Tax=Ruditapes philippinarum TaxID=129788 RepID=UPI00295BC06B|nr:hemagglutinin/amebocyte aggregation factor-like isoform X1 [Ruditapes philippinarum]